VLCGRVEEVAGGRCYNQCCIIVQSYCDIGRHRFVTLVDLTAEKMGDFSRISRLAPSTTHTILHSDLSMQEDMAFPFQRNLAKESQITLF
jgi:hypothetical protein